MHCHTILNAILVYFILQGYPAAHMQAQYMQQQYPYTYAYTNPQQQGGAGLYFLNHFNSFQCGSLPI